MSDFKMNLQLFADPAAETTTTPRSYLPNNFSDAIHAREIDFVTRFDDNWSALIQLLGIMRPIRKTPGTQLVSYKVKFDKLAKQAAPGAVIPYSQSETEVARKADLALELYSAAATIQDVAKYGAQIAVEKQDEAFLTALQLDVMYRFYDFIKTGSLIGTATNWQMALAQAQGMVLNKFMAMRKNVTEIVGFANVNDAYAWLGSSTISTQTAFGMTYLQNFMGYSTLLLLPDTLIPQGTVLATPAENIDLYYIDPGDGDFARMGLVYTVKGQTNLIGFHAEGNYSTAVGESYAIMGMTLWAEFLDGIANVKIVSSPFGKPTLSGPAQNKDYWGHTTSEFQADDLTVQGDTINATLYDFDGWASGPLAGPGHFLAVKFSGIDAGASGVRVGLVPSASGMALQTLDEDKDIVVKIGDKERQQLVVELYDATGKTTVYTYSLGGLKYEAAPGA